LVTKLPGEYKYFIFINISLHLKQNFVIKGPGHSGDGGGCERTLVIEELSIAAPDRC
jgi:hypothetical protein